MYTHEITSQANGLAVVAFSNGDTETYTEQVIVSDAVFATETTPFIPPVYEIIEHTRPKVLILTLPDNASLTENINKKLDELNGVEPAPPTEEELAAIEARLLWTQKKAALKAMISDMRDMQALGATITPEKLAIMQTLAQWCDANVKEEYYS